MDDYTRQQITDRREQLAKYRAVYAETYGRHLDPAEHEARDQQLADLEARPVRAWRIS